MPCQMSELIVTHNSVNNLKLLFSTGFLKLVFQVEKLNNKYLKTLDLQLRIFCIELYSEFIQSGFHFLF